MVIIAGCPVVLLATVEILSDCCEDIHVDGRPSKDSLITMFQLVEPIGRDGFMVIIELAVCVYMSF